jgi:hypothetical protein
MIHTEQHGQKLAQVSVSVKNSRVGADGDNGRGIWMAMLGVCLSADVRAS